MASVVSSRDTVTIKKKNTKIHVEVSESQGLCKFFILRLEQPKICQLIPSLKSPTFKSWFSIYICIQIFLFIWNRDSQCSHGWPQTFRDWYVVASRVLRLKASGTTLSIFISLYSYVCIIIPSPFLPSISSSTPLLAVFQIHGLSFINCCYKHECIFTYIFLNI